MPPVRIVAGLACLFLAVTPARIAISQARLNDAAAAYERGDCPAAIDASLSSSEAAGTRAEPFLLLGICDARLGRDDLAVRALENAVERDPDNWQYHYALAIVRGYAGRDPRPAAREALRLNPREPLVRQAVQRTRPTDPARWREFGTDAPLPTR